jgi:apolipoprotein D and lipocalin family protein
MSPSSGRAAHGVRRFSALDAAVLGATTLGVTVLVANCVRSRPIGNPGVPQPARSVELSRYLGLWYEIARYDASFERGCEGVTAEYSLRPDGLIRVLNTCRVDASDGRLRVADGKAKVVPGSGNTKLKVSFFGPFFYGDYWVLDHAEDYSWSIVGEPTGRYLWILCRDPAPTDTAKEALIGRAAELGYDTSLLRMTRQPPA